LIINIIIVKATKIYNYFWAKEGWEEELAASLYENWQIYEWMHGNDSK
jgi:hypothetical protein